MRCPPANVDGVSAIRFPHIIHIGQTTEIEHCRRPSKKVAVKIKHPQFAIQCGPAARHHRPGCDTVGVTIDQPRHDDAASGVNDLPIETIRLNVACCLNTTDKPVPQEEAPTVDYLCMRDNCSAMNEGIQSPTPKTFMILDSQPCFAGAVCRVDGTLT